MANTKLSEIASGGTLDTATDTAVAVRGGTTDVLVSFAAVAASGSAADLTTGTLPSGRLSGSYTGVTGVGTLTAGAWNATAIAPTYGGTGQDTHLSTGVAQVSGGTWSVSTALANGTTATTQTAGDNSTKVATTAYVDALTTGVSSVSGDGTYITNSGSTGAVTLTNTFGSAAQKTAATTATAGDVVLRDSNANVFNNNSLQNATKTTSAGGTTTLTAPSSRYQALTGSSSQTYKLPDATTLSLGPWFTFNNNSSGSLIISNNGGTTLYTVPAGGIVQTGPTDISTANGAWDFHGYFPGTVTWGSGTTGLVFNTALSTTPSIDAGASSSSNATFRPQRGTTGTGYSGDSTHLYGLIGGAAAWTAAAATFNIPTGSTYQINATDVLSNNTLGSGVVTSSLTTVGTIGTGTWQGSIVTGTYGGTGVNNGSSTITIGGNVTFSGAHTFTGTLSANTSVTFPSSGTLAILGANTFTAEQTFAAATTGASSINIPSSSGTNVTAPVSGDMWWNGTNLYFYNGSTNKDLLAGGSGSPGGSNTQVQYNNSGSFGGITGATTDGTALTLVAPILGTPASGTLTNCDGTAASLTAGHVTNATFTTALTVNTGTLTLTANAANTSVLTIGAGAVSVSGSNTGDQTITLTGAVTGSGTGSFATTIATPGTLTVSSTNSTATAHTHAITSSSAPGAAASILATDSSGIIGSTGTRIVKGWFTDLTVTNAIAGSITGNAATVTTNANLTGAVTSSGNATTLVTGIPFSAGSATSVSNQTYNLVTKAAFAGTINSILGGQTDSGSVTVAIKINGTNVTGLSAVSLTSTPADTNATAANTFSSGDIITAVFSSGSSDLNASFFLKITRT